MATDDSKFDAQSVDRKGSDAHAPHGSVTEQDLLKQTQMRLHAMYRVTSLLSAVNKPRRFLRTAMVFCNELAAQWACERVSLGIIKGRYVRLKALSHTEHFSRKMELIQDIESAMEECFDQDTEVAFPAQAEVAVINKAAAQLSQKHGPSALLSIPLRLADSPPGKEHPYENDDVKAVVTLERPVARPFDPTTVEIVALSCSLCSPRLLNLQQQDRWFGARLAASLRRGLSTLVGVQHTWIKLTALAVLGFVLFAFLAKGRYRVKSSCLIEAIVQQNISAPFDGFIKDVNVEVGDLVTTDHPLLGELDTAELRLRLASAKAELTGYLKQADTYMRDGQTAQAQIARADADRVQSDIDLLSYMIQQAQLTAPVDGIVVKGDLKRKIGAPASKGDILFEVAPLSSLRAQVMVPEDQILDIHEGEQGTLATVSYPDQKIPFVVERISPMAEVVNNRNVFRVRVRLDETRQWMRPGMEGVAKIDIDQRRYAWIWTRKLVNWIRLKLWI